MFKNTRRTFCTLLILMAIGFIKIQTATAQLKLNVSTGIQLPVKLIGSPVQSANTIGSPPKFEGNANIGDIELNILLGNYYLNYSNFYYAFGLGFNYNKSFSSSEGGSISHTRSFLTARFGYDFDAYRIYGLFQGGIAQISTQDLFTDGIKVGAARKRHPNTGNYEADRSKVDNFVWLFGVGSEWKNISVNLTAQLPTRYRYDVTYDRLNDAGEAVYTDNVLTWQVEEPLNFRITVGYTFSLFENF